MTAKICSTEYVVASDGTKVYFDCYSRGHKNVVVIAHGFFNSKEAVLLKELGSEFKNQYDCIIMDFRGHGQTEGLFYWTAKECLDLQAVLECARTRYDRVAVVGFSLGAATSLITAAKFNLIDSLVAVSAPASFEEIEFHFWDIDIENDIYYNTIGEGKIGKGVRPGPFWLPKDKPSAVVEKIKIPVFYIHGDHDWLIRPWHSQVLYDKTQSQKKLAIIKNGPHAEYLVRKNRDEFVGLIQGWLNETIK